MEKSVVLVHHTGKPNEQGMTDQRGSSKLKDIMDASLLLGKGKGGDAQKLVLPFVYDKHRHWIPDEPKCELVANFGEAGDRCSWSEVGEEQEWEAYGRTQTLVLGSRNAAWEATKEKFPNTPSRATFYTRMAK
jgi:hypothetical protein